MAAPSVTNTFTNGTSADASQVNTNFTDLINGASDGTKDYSINNLTVGGTALLNGSITLGNSSADDLTVTASLASSIPIKTTNSFNIGSSTLGLNDIFFGNGSNSNTVAISGGVTTSSYTITLPVAAGSSGQYVTTTGSGTLAFSTPTAPTTQVFTTGSGTYTTPANVRYIKVRMVGGGGGGSGGGTTGSGAGGNGGNSTFGTALLSCTGGSGASTVTGGGGGASSGGFFNISGGQGGGSVNSSVEARGGSGGISFFGGAPGASRGGTAGSTVAANTGSGGGGGGTVVASALAGAGGGAGGYLEAFISSPSATYAYAVGATGSAGSAGTSGTAASAGAAGLILVEEFYV